MAALVALAAVLLAAAAPALDGDGATLDLRSRVFPGNPHDVAVVGPVAFVGLDTGLHVFDVSDAASPVPLAHLSLPSPALDVEVAAGRAYVADEESGLRVVNVSDPSSPTVLGALQTSGTVAVAVRGTTAYLAEASRAPVNVFGLRVVDVSDPGAPAERSFYPLPNAAASVEVSGSTAYVGIGSRTEIGERGVWILDVSNPSAPALLGTLATDKPVNAVHVESGVAYLATGFELSGALVTADVSDPANPTVLATRPLGDAAVDLSLVSGSLYVAARALGVLVFDVSDPSAPLQRQALPTGRETCGVWSAGDVTFLAERSSSGEAGFTMVSTPAGPAAPAQLSSFPYAETLDGVVDGNTAYLLRRSGLEIYDVTDPAAPASLSGWAPPGADFDNIAVASGLAAISQGPSVRLVDVSDPSNPAERGIVALLSGVAGRLAMRNGTLFALDGRGFETFDVSDPSAPVGLGTYESSTGFAAGVAIQNGRLLLAAADALEILDVSSPSTPVPLSVLPLPHQPFAVSVSGDRAALAGLGARLMVVDITDPSSPVLQGVLEGGTGFGVALDGDTAFVAAGRDGLVAVDVSDPLDPRVLGYYDASGTASNVSNSGPTILLSAAEGQSWIFGCASCALACSVGVEVSSPASQVCEGTPVELHASNVQQSGCPDGLLDYQWYEEGTPIPGATGADYTVPVTHAAGDFQFQLEVRCLSNPSCSSFGTLDVGITPDTWPVIQAGSLRLAKTGIDPDEHVLSWTIGSGVGESNVHRTYVASELSPVPPDMATFLVTAPEPKLTRTEKLPAGRGVIFYRVYGRRSCSGDSAP